VKEDAAALQAKAPGETPSERIERLQRLSAQQNILSILDDRLEAQS
jgi:hypothetical protein